MARPASKTRSKAAPQPKAARGPLFRFKRKHRAFLKETAEAVARLQD